jgi:archaellum component FlaC
MSDNLWDAAGYIDEKINRLNQEIARLKAEVERLTFNPMSYLDDQGEWMPKHIHLAAVERLKAEVARLRASSFVTAVPVEEYEKLKAEVERLTNDNRQLTKAFEIAEGIIKRMGKTAEDAAKDGKPSV